MRERVKGILTDRHKILNMAMLLCIAVFAFYINQGIEIKGLYMDDLYMWSCYGEQSFLEFVFPVGTSSRFRPVYWLFTYLQMALIGPHVDRFVAFNIICNIIVAYEIFYISGKISGLRLVAFLSSICYLASRFAYYQIAQALGLMETLAQFFALLIFYLLYVFMNKENERTREELIDSGEAVLKDREEKPELSIQLVRSNDIYFAGALLLYVLVCFTHERYLCLLPLFYLVLLVKWLRTEKVYKKAYFRRELGKWIAPAVTFAVIMAIRAVSTGALVPAGTGGTEVTDTFSLSSMLGYVRDEILYIFGINAGQNYLSALSWAETPEIIRALVKVSILMIGIIAAMFIIVLLLESSEKDQEGRARFLSHMADSIYMVMFIGLCIAASSVTIRVEMRWIYVSYSASLIFAGYMVKRVTEAYGGTSSETAGLRGGKVFQAVICLVFSAYCFLSVYTNSFYRGYFGNIYFWADQLRMNSLAEETIEKYGAEGVLGKQVYILENTYGMSDFYGETFFKPYDPEKTGQGTVIHFADSIDEVPRDEVMNGEALVLMEVPEENAYRDITDEVIEEM